MLPTDNRELFKSPALLTGYVLCDEEKVWQKHLDCRQVTCLQEGDRKYQCQMANSNFDAKILNSGKTAGIYDGLVLKSKTGLSPQNIPDNVPLTTGLAAYWSRQKKVLTLISSPASSRKIFYRILAKGIVFSSDSRLLMCDGDGLDPVGVSQLIIYGAASGTKSPMAGIRTVPFGFMAKFNLRNNEITENLLPIVSYEWETLDISEDSIEASLDIIRDHLIGVLEQISQHKIALLLSGGVDSSLLACLLKDIGVKYLDMFTFEFGPNDPDVECSMRLARKIRYPHTVIKFTDDDVLQVLNECTIAYSCPFGDYSTIPSYLLVKHIATLVPKGTYLLDGTAGDCNFGFEPLFTTYQNRILWMIPALLKRLAMICYTSMNMWKYSGRIPHLFGRVGSATTNHPTLLEFPLHALSGKLNVSSDELLDSHREMFESGQAILKGSSFSDSQLLSALDFAHNCSGLFSNKVANPARHFGCAAEFPFMWPEIVNLGFSLPLWFKNYQDRIKFPLKHILKRYVDKGYIERRKSGFTPPLKRWLTQPEINTWFRNTIEKRTVLREILGGVKIESMVRKTLNNPNYFVNGVYNLIWLVSFTELWFAQAQRSALSTASEKCD